MSEYACPHCGTIPCECDMSDGARLMRSLESNRQLREELEIANGICNTFWDALKLLKLNAINVHNPGRHFTQRITTLNETLAAAKHALQTCRCLEPEQRKAVANALARIAECEKET